MADQNRILADDNVPDQSLGFWAKCRKCAHCWIAAYYPAPMDQVAKLMMKAACPKCGDTRPVMARQDAGRLLEGESDG